jgi:hypothetical protein
MNVFSSRAGLLTAVTLAGMLAACDNSYSPSSAMPTTLYERYGGAATVSKVVDDAVVGLLADPMTAPFFAGLGKPGNSSPERARHVPGAERPG